MLKNYESMIILNPSLTDETSKQHNEKIQSFIKDNGGEMVKTDEWGKKKLAYEILDFDEGIYFINYFSFDPLKITDYEREMKLDENVIRYNILVK
jgi:small subunit ribosomal protein S6